MVSYPLSVRKGGNGVTKKGKGRETQGTQDTQGARDIVLSTDKGLTVGDLMCLQPSDVIRFSVYDHEETKLFGIMRDEMMGHRTGETRDSWEERVAEVQDWNRRRSKLMTAVFVNAVCRRYGVENDVVQVFRLSYLMVAGDSSVEDARKLYGQGSEVTRCFEEAFGGTVAAGGDKLTSGGILGLLGGGCNEGEGSAADSEASSPGL